jgi:uroporphyrinogen-III decarboxylase
MKDEFWSVPLRAGGLLQERYGNEVAVAGFLNSPMVLGGEIMGYEELLMATWSEPDLVIDLFNRIIESSFMYGEHLARMGIGYVFIEDATCSPEVNTPEGLEKFDLAFLSKIMSNFRSKGVRSIVHNCNTNPYLDGYLKMELDALHIIPKAEDRKDVYDKFRKRTTVIGGIDQTFLLFKGTPAQVETEVRSMMSDWGDSPGYMIAPGCEMAFKTPIENIIALREAAAQCSIGAWNDG